MFTCCSIYLYVLAVLHLHLHGDDGDRGFLPPWLIFYLPLIGSSFLPVTVSIPHVAMVGLPSTPSLGGYGLLKDMPQLETFVCGGRVIIW